MLPHPSSATGTRQSGKVRTSNAASVQVGMCNECAAPHLFSRVLVHERLVRDVCKDPHLNPDSAALNFKNLALEAYKNCGCSWFTDKFAFGAFTNTASMPANPKRAFKLWPSQLPAVHTQDSLPPSLLTSKRSPAGQPRGGRWVVYGAAYESPTRSTLRHTTRIKDRCHVSMASVPPPDGSSKMTLNLSSGFCSSTYSILAF